MHSALVASHRGLLNRKNVVFCVENGFRPSERFDDHRSSLDGIGGTYDWRFTIYPTDFETIRGAERINPFPTKRINIFPFNAPAQKRYRGGMHKCIPYESSRQIPIYQDAATFGQRKKPRRLARLFYMLALPIFLVSAMYCHAVATLRWSVAGIWEKMKNRIQTDTVILYVGITYLPGKSPCKYCRRRWA